MIPILFDLCTAHVLYKSRKCNCFCFDLHNWRNSFRFATRTKHVNLQRIIRRNYRTLWCSVLCFSQLYLKAFWQTVTGFPLDGGSERVLVPHWNLRIKGENYVWIKMIGNSPWLIPLDSKFYSGLCDMIDCTTFFTFFFKTCFVLFATNELIKS